MGDRAGAATARSGSARSPRARWAGSIPQRARIVEYALPTPNSQPQGIVLGADGAIWGTEAGGNKVFRMTMNGRAREFAIPTANSVPVAITRGRDGYLWVSELEGGKLLRVSKDGRMREFPLPRGARPYGLASAPDGNVWFADRGRSRIGLVTPAGRVFEYPLVDAERPADRDLPPRSSERSPSRSSSRTASGRCASRRGSVASCRREQGQTSAWARCLWAADREARGQAKPVPSGFTSRGYGRARCAAARRSPRRSCPASSRAPRSGPRTCGCTPAPRLPAGRPRRVSRPSR